MSEIEELKLKRQALTNEIFEINKKINEINRNNINDLTALAGRAFVTDTNTYFKIFVNKNSKFPVSAYCYNINNNYRSFSSGNVITIDYIQNMINHSVPFFAFEEVAKIFEEEKAARNKLRDDFNKQNDDLFITYKSKIEALK